MDTSDIKNSKINRRVRSLYEMVLECSNEIDEVLVYENEVINILTCRFLGENNPNLFCSCHFEKSDIVAEVAYLEVIQLTLPLKFIQSPSAN